MSYDISLCDPITGETLETESTHMMTGGTFTVGGTRELWLNVTYNYADWYYRPDVFPIIEGESKGIRAIYGLTGAESIPVLKKAIDTLKKLNEDISEEERTELEKHGTTGYWMPTKENAIRPLCQLLAMAQMRPDGVWAGD